MTCYCQTHRSHKCSIQLSGKVVVEVGQVPGKEWGAWDWSGTSEGEFSPLQIYISKIDCVTHWWSGSILECKWKVFWLPTWLHPHDCMQHTWCQGGCKVRKSHIRHFPIMIMQMLVFSNNYIFVPKAVTGEGGGERTTLTKLDGVTQE